MHKGTAVISMLITFVAGYFLGGFANKGGHQIDKDEVTEAADSKGGPKPGGDDIERYRVPLEGSGKGPTTAKVNIVEFSDFQCPFCSRVGPTLDKLMKEFPKDVKLYFRHNPLDFHQDAPLASQATLAAGEQGKFWEMHDKLFANQQNIKRPDLEKYAQELGLDMKKFQDDLDQGKHRSKVQGDMALAKQLGVQGTPNFFINGRPIRGAQPFEEFKKVVEDEISRADKLIAQGTPVGQVYSKLMTGALTSPKAPGGSQGGDKPKAPPAGTEVYKISVGEAATKGSKEPKVTIVEFSEFQCPFCSKVNPTIAEVMKTYGNDVQVAFRHNPLSFHQNAMIAAMASEAAREQGKFWEMHDKLFSNQQALTRPDLEKYAGELGLNVEKFKSFLDREAAKKRIETDMADAAKFGARGTPNFFVNGRNVRGAQPFEAFKTVIDEEIKKADEKIKAGTARKDVYAELTKNGLEKAAAPAPQQRPGAPDPNTVYRAEVGNAPVKGPKDALVTIVQYSDYECPFCSRVEPTINKVMEEYKGKVRVAWKDMPLPFHKNAIPAAIAAREAGAQGKFWEMHAKLFENQKALDRASLEKYAQELGLNMQKFKAALDGEKYKNDINSDAIAGQKIGASGTPAFFVNGRFLSGAQPFEQFKTVIDTELKNAEALIAKGTPRTKVYDALMKAAKTEVTKGAAPGGAEKGPEEDKTVHKVDPGNGPSAGPKNAPITMVIYSDFQCPFCKRVEPTISQVEKEYAGKVRKVWKNSPLPFHDKAGPAAEAALAAHAQGKFWQMHAKLFENMQALDRPSLEKYAQEIGLEMGRFKAEMDSGKYKAQVEAEKKEAEAVGVQGTPAVFINGRKINGAYPFETFKKIVDEELAKKGVKVLAKK